MRPGFEMNYQKEIVLCAALLFCLVGLAFAGEIVVSPTTSSRSGAVPAASSREKARSYLDDKDSPAPTILVLPEEEDGGVLSPRGMGVPQDNRSKARDYIRDSDSGLPTAVIIPTDQAPGTDSSRRQNTERNLGKARGYLDGGGAGSGSKAGTYVQLGTSVGVVGSDGVIVFDCSVTSNTAGRIGEDLHSGSEFVVVIGGKKQKARCR